MNVSIIIATYGENRWRELAEERALPSAQQQGCEVLIAPLLLTPAISYSKPHHKRLAPGKLLPKRTPDLHDGNHLVLGTLVPTDLFFAIGGFLDWNARTGNEFDDWDLWIRCMRAGAEIVQVPDAVYVHMEEPNSRHRTADRETKLMWQYEIGVTYFPDFYGPHWVKGHLRRDQTERMLQRRREKLGR